MADFKRLELFLRVAERLSISKAAEDLNMPQPTATRWISELEHDYGVRLLNRSTRRLTLTEQGSKVAAHAQRLLASEMELRGRLASDAAEIRGRIAVSAPTGLGSRMVIPAIIAFRALNPALTIELRLSDAYHDLVGEGIDVALRIGKLDDNRLVAQRLGSLREIAVCHRSLAETIDPDDCCAVSRLPWIRFSALRQAHDVVVSNRTSRRKIEVAPWLWLDSVSGLRDALKGGAGATLIHAFAVADEIASGELVQLLPSWTLPSWQLWSVRPAGKSDRRVDTLVSHLKRSFAGIRP